MREDKLLEGRIAIVTGSGQGIGREIALCMAMHGAKVSIREETGVWTIEDLRKRVKEELL